MDFMLSDHLKSIMLGAGPVGLYWERLELVKYNILRLTPSSPSSGGERTALLFAALHALLSSEQERSPEEIAVMLQRWMALEEQAASVLHDAEMSRSLAASSSWSSLTPLRALQRRLSSSGIGESVSGMSRAASRDRRTASMAGGLHSMRDNVASTSVAGPAGGGSVPATPRRIVEEDDLLSDELEAVREALLAKACLGLLHWWLMTLLELSFRAERSRTWWRTQARRPLRHQVWLGPRHWVGVIRVASVAALNREPSLLLHQLGGGAAGGAGGGGGGGGGGGAPEALSSPPSAMLHKLADLLLVHARLIGRLRHRISDLHHTASRAELALAIHRAIGTLAQLAHELAPDLPNMAADLGSSSGSGSSVAVAVDAAAAINAAASAAAAAAAAASAASPSSSVADHTSRPPPLHVPNHGNGNGNSGGAPSSQRRAAATPKIATCAELQARCAQCRPASAACVAAFAPLERPSHLNRNWMAYCGGGLLVAGVALQLRRSDALVPLLRSYWSATSATATSFWREHVVAPATLMWRELVHRDYLHVSDPRALQQADEDLHILLRQFRNTWGVELEKVRASQGTLEGSAGQAAAQTATAFAAAGGGGGDGGGIGGIGGLGGGGVGGGGGGASSVPVGHALARRPSDYVVEGDMAAISRLFEVQLQSPAYNMVQGPLLQMLIIQTQYMKQQLLQQMAAMDTLLRENFFTASLAALLPGSALILATISALRGLLRRLRSRRRSRRSLVKQVRSVLRDVERLLIASLSRHHAPPPPPPPPPPLSATATAGGADAAAASSPSSFSAAEMGGPGRLSEVESGLLVISVHALRQALEAYRVLLAPGERQSLVEDLDELESEMFGVEQKLRTIERMYRTQPSLLAPGVASGIVSSRHRDLASSARLAETRIDRGRLAPRRL